MGASDHRRTPLVFTPAEAKVAEWILSGKKKFPQGLDRRLKALVMAKLMLSLSPPSGARWRKTPIVHRPFGKLCWQGS